MHTTRDAMGRGVRRATVALLSVGALVLHPAPCSAQQPTEDFKQAVRRSSFIFEGTVTAVGQANVPNVAANPRTALVLVSQVLVGPDAWRRALVGRTVTLLMNVPVAANATRAVFFSSGWVFGGGYAFREVSREVATAAPDFVPGVAARIAAAQRAMDDDALSAELDRAVAVVIARVDTVYSARSSPARGETDARWRDTRLTILSRLKWPAGARLGAPGRVYVPGSGRVPWAMVEKVRSSDVRLFVLLDARTLRTDFPELPADLPFVVVDAQHVRPAADSTRVKPLLGRIP